MLQHASFEDRIDKEERQEGFRASVGNSVEAEVEAHQTSVSFHVPYAIDL